MENPLFITSVNFATFTFVIGYDNYIIVLINQNTKREWKLKLPYIFKRFLDFGNSFRPPGHSRC